MPHLLTNVDTLIHFEETIFPAVSIIDLEKDEEIVDERKGLFDEINILDVKNEAIIVSNPYDVVFQPDGKGNCLSCHVGEFFTDSGYR